MRLQILIARRLHHQAFAEAREKANPLGTASRVRGATRIAQPCAARFGCEAVSLEVVPETAALCASPRKPADAIPRGTKTCDGLICNHLRTQDRQCAFTRSLAIVLLRDASVDAFQQFAHRDAQALGDLYERLE